MSSKTRGYAALWVSVLVLAGACGGSDSSGPPASGLKTVLVTNNEFQPLSVSITAGDTIVWAWQTAPQSVGHNVLSTGAPSFTSVGDLTTFFNAPKSHQVIFNTAGTYEYYCSAHGTTGGPSGNTGMHGTVVVAP